jgi:hypothetical protein
MEMEMVMVMVMVMHNLLIKYEQQNVGPFSPPNSRCSASDCAHSLTNPIQEGHLFFSKSAWFKCQSGQAIALVLNCDSNAKYSINQS